MVAPANIFANIPAALADEQFTALWSTDTVALKRGDYLYIPPHARHRVEWTDPDHVTVWLAIHHGASLDRPQAATDVAST
jgi:glyoxylate utilization-related uncharacterized protein